jgi:hypothetical protein
VLDPKNIFSREIVHYSRLKLSKEFLKEEAKRSETVAYQASEEVHEMMQDTSYLYKAWQCTDYEVETKTLHSTWDEIFILWNTEAMYRSHFACENGKITLPNFFVKVMGVKSDIKSFRKMLDHLLDVEESVLLQQFSSSKSSNISEQSFYEVTYTNKRGELELDSSKLLKASWWKYSHLREHVQKLIATRIAGFVKEPGIKADNVGQRDLVFSAFKTLCALDENILTLIQNFDYPKKQPKAIIYNDGTSGNFGVEDAILVWFLKDIGFDVLVFNPAGYRDIENYFTAGSFHTHSLEKMQVNVSYTKESKKENLISKLLKFGGI